MKMKMKTIQTFNIPIVITEGERKPKNFFLNLNNYNKWYFQDKNKLKKKFKIQIIETVRQLKKVDKCYISYEIFYPTKREFDLDNVGSILSKFTHDVLTEVGVIKDDNYNIVECLTFKFGGVDKENPRAIVTIEGYKDKKGSKNGNTQGSCN